ncbi:E3 Ubiquitin ligase [Musa troglodytarum]|uniref:E3 Ubiquitin ligase n=1 Tax=Musa troglodytarum TaxID=320322 RepID=A0A9E7G6J3_9LILI|nr:E3 Ubiquitin ligase [Musa troglodytarum]URE07543.1 E3 Ubiquitin ligase [Musa troglodytarum]
MSFRDHEMAAAVGRIVLAYDGAIAGLALAAFAAVSWVKYLAASAALVRIRRATSVPISGLRSLLSSDDSSDEDGVLVVVRGRVQPSFTVEALGGWPLSKFRDVLTPRGSGERAVAVLSTQTCLYNEWRGMFGWSSDLNALLVRSWKERRSSSLELPIHYLLLQFIMSCTLFNLLHAHFSRPSLVVDILWHCCTKKRSFLLERRSLQLAFVDQEIEL